MVVVLLKDGHLWLLNQERKMLGGFGILLVMLEWVVTGGFVYAMGGAHTDSMTVCSLNFQRGRSGSADKITGCRGCKIN